MDAYRTALAERSGAAIDGEQLVVPRGLELPRLCAKCGATKKLTRRTVRFDTVPVVVYASFFLASPILFGILYAAMRRTADVTLSMCTPCTRQTLDAKAILRLTFVGALILFVGILTAIFNGAPWVGLGLAVVGAVVAVPAMKSARRRDLSASYIGPDRIVLRGVHFATAQQLVESTTPPPP